jgi:Ca-activated chloride channel family protein
MSALAQFHFLRPWALLALLALPLFWRLWRGGGAQGGAWRGVVDAHLLPHLLARVDAGRSRTGLVLGAAAWTLACLALAGPAWERAPMPLYRNQAARVLALELAPTMLAQDVKPDRLSRARFKLLDILARSRDYQTALIGYAGEAFVAAPLTDDVGTVANLVDALDPGTMPVAGNAASRAIDSAMALVEQAGLHRGEIILLADGVDADAVAAARKAHARGLTVSVLGLGSEGGAPVPLPQGDFLKDAAGNIVVTRLDAAALREVAAAGGGRYVPLNADARDLDALLADQAERSTAAAPGDDDGVAGARWQDRGAWLLLGLLPLALLGFRRGWLMALALAVLAPPVPAQAASFADLWQRADQQAASALAQGDAPRAAGLARSPAWKASAAYRAGDYETAANEYAKAGGADGAYNRGNALAKLGRYEDALAAYDEALRLAPDMADAQANRQAVEAFLQHQQQEPRPKNDKSAGQDPQEPQSGQDAQPQEQPAQGGQQNQDASSSAPQDASSSDEHDDAPNQQAGRPQPPAGGDAKEQKADPAAAQKPDAQQQQALSQAIDQALAGQPQGEAGQDPAQATPHEDEATREKRQALDNLLQRVPDDPGGLLRRKFQLEYQRRRQGGGDGP